MVVDQQRPGKSLLLRKTGSGGDADAGGSFWDDRLDDYAALEKWIIEGAWTIGQRSSAAWLRRGGHGRNHEGIKPDKEWLQ